MPWIGILGSLFTAKGTQSNVLMVLSNNNNINEENNEDCIVKIIGEPISIVFNQSPKLLQAY